jgi:hypothetical protein
MRGSINLIMMSTPSLTSALGFGNSIFMSIRPSLRSNSVMAYYNFFGCIEREHVNSFNKI